MMQALPEQIPAAEPDPLDVIAEANDLATLDEELNRLPEKYRNVLVMSYFCQQTNQQIADQLNETKGAVDGRIRDARRLLRVRLTGRGVEIGALTIAATLISSKASAASPALIHSTIQFAGFGTGLSGVENVTGVDLARMRLLTSTGTPIMSMKTGLLCTAILLGFSGAFGLSQLVATQDGLGSGLGTSSESLALDIGVGSESSTENSDPFSDGGAVEVVAAAESKPAQEQKQGTIELEVEILAAAETKPAPVAETAFVPSAKPSTNNGKKGAVAEFSRTSARGAERKINEMMGVEKIPALNFPGENSLGDILKVIAGHLTETSGVPVRILLDETDPDIGSNANLLNETRVSDVELSDITIDSALRLIFAKVKDQDPGLTWIAQGEVILIATTDTANDEDHLMLRSYDISKLRDLEFPVEGSVHVMQGGGMGGGGGGMGGGGGYFLLQESVSPKSPDHAEVPEHNSSGGEGQGASGMGHGEGHGPTVERVPTPWESGLSNVIMSLAVPDSWLGAGGDEIGTLSIAGNRLLVRQTRKGHEKVVEVLEELELAAAEMSEEQ